MNGGAGTAYTIVETSEGNRLIRDDYLSYTSDGKIIISPKSTEQHGNANPKYKYFSERNAYAVGCYRVDNLDFNEDVVNAVLKRHK